MKLMNRLWNLKECMKKWWDIQREKSTSNEINQHLFNLLKTFPTALISTSYSLAL